MKKLIMKVIRSISAMPIIGWPLRFLMSIASITRMRDTIHEINLKTNHLGQEIDRMSHEMNRINHMIDRMSHENERISNEINEINLHINHINLQQKVFDTQHLPSLDEMRSYQQNLKKSLPVVLRQHHRSMLKKQKK